MDDPVCVPTFAKNERPSQESKLSYMGHVVIENRNALVLGCVATHAPVGADRAYDTRDFVLRLREQGHGRTTRFEGYRISQVARKRVEHLSLIHI